MNLPYVENGILHFENSCFPIKNFRFEAMMEMIGSDASLKTIFLNGTNQVSFEFPNSVGIASVYFLYDDCEYDEADGGTLEFKGDMLFTEIHFHLYIPIPLEMLMERHGQVQLLESDSKRLAAFNQNYLAEMENGLVTCLWFINSEILKKSDDPLYTMLREIFN